MPTVMIMTKKFAEVSRDPITTLEQAGFTVEVKDYDRVQPSRKTRSAGPSTERTRSS